MDALIDPLVNNLRSRQVQLMESNVSIEEFEKQTNANHEAFLRRMDMIMALEKQRLQVDLRNFNPQRKEFFAKPAVSPAYKKPVAAREITIVPVDQQCTVPGCERKKCDSATFCKFHKCAKCDKRTHAKHGIYCRDCDK
jgi:hypothetical protein